MKTDWVRERTKKKFRFCFDYYMLMTSHWSVKKIQKQKNMNYFWFFIQSGSFSNLTEILWLKTYSKSLVKIGWKLIKLESRQKRVKNWHTYWLTKHKRNVHNFLTTHTIWLIIKHHPDNLVTNIFTMCSEDRMKAD